MCPKPEISAPQQYQSSRSPVYRDRSQQSPQGRQSTLLTGGMGTSGQGEGMMDAAPTGKKTLLGA